MANPYESGFYSSPFEGITSSTSFGGQKFPMTPFKSRDKTTFSPESIPFPLIGTDLVTGKRDQNILTSTRFPVPQTDSTGYGTGAALPGISQGLRDLIAFDAATAPSKRQARAEEYELAAQLSQRQLNQLYPLLSRAGAEATARSLAASQAYRAFAEQLPSSVQNIMASKQQQMATAAGAEAALQQATAMQQEAASKYPGRFAGQYVSFG